MPNSTTRRRLTLVDAMVLVAAIAVGLALTRFHDKYHIISVITTVLYGWDKSRLVGANSITIMVGVVPPQGPNLSRLVHWCVWSAIAGASLPPALLVLHLLPPRRSPRRIFRAPGAVACASATLGLVASCLSHLFFLKILRRFPSEAMFQSGMFAAYAAGFAVAGSWCALLLGGRWRPEPTWLDRAGRVTGVYWVTLAFCLVLAGF